MRRARTLLLLAGLGVEELLVGLRAEELLLVWIAAERILLGIYPIDLPRSAT
jgi:hypothetical protein